MKAYKTIYKHGHFVDIETGKRLNFIAKGEYTITAANDCFTEVDEKLVIPEPLNSEQKLQSLLRKFDRDSIRSILPAGEKLYFRVGNSKVLQSDESRQYMFQCILLEDLYLTKLKKRSGDQEKDWRLSSVICELEVCTYGDLEITEKIRGTSLSNLFSRTVQFYFSNQRSTAINAFADFYLLQEDLVNNPHTELTLSRAANHLEYSLADIRQEIVSYYKNDRFNAYNNELLDR